MSNTAFIIPTRFVDLNRDGSESDVSYGIRVSDEYDSVYDNVQIESAEELLELSDAQLVEMARGLNERAAGIIDHARESASGIYIFGRLVEWKDLEPSAPSA